MCDLDESKVVFSTQEEQYEKVGLIFKRLGINNADEKARLCLAVYPNLELNIAQHLEQTQKATSSQDKLKQKGNTPTFSSLLTKSAEYKRFFYDLRRDPLSQERSSVAYKKFEIENMLNYLMQNTGINIVFSEFVESSKEELQIMLGESFEYVTYVEKIYHDANYQNDCKLELNLLVKNATRMVPSGKDLGLKSKNSALKLGQKFVPNLKIPKALPAGKYYSAFLCIKPDGFELEGFDKPIPGLLIVGEQSKHDTLDIVEGCLSIPITQELQTADTGEQYLCCLIANSEIFSFSELSPHPKIDTVYLLGPDDIKKILENYIKAAKKLKYQQRSEFGADALLVNVL